ncbi:hypothetical protein IU411_21445 [Nocardia farcinica]|nr:hypothetical protein [Nocardia farcinica]
MTAADELPPPDNSTPPAQPGDGRELVWSVLAPAIAGYPAIRVIDPATNTTVRTRSRIPARPPAQPAAVPVYDRAARTDKLVLDLDAKAHGPVAVARDAARARAWLQACGARVVSDRNPGNGGRHLIAFFAAGETYSRADVEPVLRRLAERLPTLDLTPMLNVRTGSITPPGSATRDGHFRVLDGSLEDALAAVRQRSEPGLLERLRAFLGPGAPEAVPTPAAPLPAPASASADLWEGAGADARLRAPWQCRTPVPAAVLAFAETGALPADGRWPSRSEARAAVLAATALRGWSLTDVRAHLTAWPGMAQAYARYRDPERALSLDWDRICTRWVAPHAHLFRSSEHRDLELTPPRVSQRSNTPISATSHREWLARAYAWTFATWPGQSYRWTVLAVLDALAYAAAVTREPAAGATAPVAAVGVRSLASFAGLLSVGTVADVLADLRDRPGSPVLRVRRAAGTLADAYALVTPRRGEDLDHEIDPVPLERVQVRQVHDAWRVLGLHARYLYELVESGLTSTKDLIAAAGLARSTAYDSLAVLAQAGLITRGRGTVTLGPTTLDDIAARHGLHHLRTETLARHRAQRAAWHTWLEMRWHLTDEPSTDQPSIPLAPWDTDDELHEAIWATQMATGPPEP